MDQVLGYLLALQANTTRNFVNYAFDIALPRLNLVAIQGGDNANRICGHCQLDIDMCSLPGMNDSDLVQLLADTLDALAEKYPDRISFKSIAPKLTQFFRRSGQ